MGHTTARGPVLGACANPLPFGGGGLLPGQDVFVLQRTPSPKAVRRLIAAVGRPSVHAKGGDRCVLSLRLIMGAGLFWVTPGGRRG